MDAINSFTFSPAQQKWFAECSGDYNPIHLDSKAARREMTGGTIAHGVHVLLRALEFYLIGIERRGVKAVRFERINCRFSSPVYPETPVNFRIECEQGNSSRLDVIGSDRVLVKCRLTWEEIPDAQPHNFPAEPGTAWPIRPENRTITQLQSLCGRTPLHIGPVDVREAFPTILRLAGSCFLADMMAITRVIGMISPGLRSMLSSFDLVRSPHPDTDSLEYRVLETDERFSLVRMKVVGATLGGTVEAFYRPGPSSQESFLSAKERVPAKTFCGQRALILGGSRGIGEATAKLIAAGGGRVLITYKVGEGDAQRVCDEINRNGGSAGYIRFDAAQAEPGLANLDAMRFVPTHVYYFATPRLVRTPVGRFNFSVFQAYSEIYLKGFADLYAGILVRSRNPLVFLYPSSVAIDEQTPNLGEYICAKEAGEALCRLYTKQNARARIVICRIPLVKTDLTSSIIDSEAANAVDIMLPILKSIVENEPIPREPPL